MNTPWGHSVNVCVLATAKESGYEITKVLGESSAAGLGAQLQAAGEG